MRVYQRIHNALRRYYYRVQGDFARAVATLPEHISGKPPGWLMQATYRLGMYASAAALPWRPAGRRDLVPALVSMAACGQHARVCEALAMVRWARMPPQRRVALADALAPFMPIEALQVLEPVRDQAPPALFAALLLRTGHIEHAREVLNAALAAGQARRYPELHLYHSMADLGTPSQQLAALNRFLAAHKVPPVALLRAHEPPNPCNVCVAEPPAAVDGPLVSVLMTTYNTGARALAAIESLLAQSWRNLEILVADDASGDNTPDLVAALAVQDPRVRLLRLPANGGTYLAKNIALHAARGEFVTCHDSDDWSHPLKIERQVRPLLENPALVATTSQWVRVQDDGVYYARPVHPLMRLNPSSPLFRRELVLGRMGPWDCVRTGADSEFLARLRLVFGQDALQRIAQPLALGAHRAGSLMTADTTGYAENGLSPQRLAYWEAWSGWHLDCLRRGKLPALPSSPQALAAWIQQRPFAVPAEIAVDAGRVAAALRSRP